MKKIAAVVALAIVAGAAGASGITVKTGQTYDWSQPDGDTYLTVVSNDVAGSPAVAETSYDRLSMGSLTYYALESTIKFDVTAPTSFAFRAGVDLGGGGALFLDGVLLDSKSTDMWWNYNYDDPSQFLAGSSTSPLGVGVHTLTLVGIEDCCSGESQVQFSTDGGHSYTSFSSTDGMAAVPEAQAAAMLLGGLGLLATVARRRKSQA